MAVPLLNPFSALHVRPAVGPPSGHPSAFSVLDSSPALLFFCSGFCNMNDLPQCQFTSRILFSIEPEQHQPILNDVLGMFQFFDGMDCDVNEYIFPMLTPLQQMNPPSIEQMTSFWAAWDEPLSELRRVHLAVVQPDLFAAMTDAARASGFSWTIGTPNAANQLETRLECHLIPPTEWIEFCGRLYGEFRRLRLEMNQLTAAHQETRALLGRVIEALAARDPSLASELGLLLQTEDIAEHQAFMTGGT